MLAILLTTAFATRAPSLLYVDAVGPEPREFIQNLEERGVDVYRVFSRPFIAGVEQKGAPDEELDALMSLRAPSADDDVPTWASLLLDGDDADVLGVMCASDAGLATAERLQHALVERRSNGVEPARRDKYLMHEAVRAAGLAAAAQAVARDAADLEAFVATRPRPLELIVKPRRGQASVRVGRASSEAQARHMLGMLLEEAVSLDDESVPGAPTALLQECLAGDEWAVDTVSRDGEHKCVALWRYDKGEANGAPFVNFSDELMAVAGEREESLVRYVFGCLDALGWRWGPCHVEVKLTPDRGPVLVEVNAGRPNGVDFRLICDACVGYNQYDVCADLYLTGGALFDELPTMPPPTLAAAGRLVKLVCAASGVLGGVNFEEAIGALPSLVRFEVEREEGDHIDATVDLASCAGYAHLVHQDADAVERDYRALRALQDEGLFEVSVHCR